MAQAFDISAGSTTTGGQSRPAVINPGKCYGLQHPRGVGGRLGVRPLKSGFLKYGSVFAQPQDRKSRQKHVDIAGHG
ncbi:MAG: hypothetical protein BGO16_09620 [Nitrobacter sp. 62-23]|nr:MAG: hypothetical protein BGO16_09620 [Nitrobacter sp. 62-23]